MKKNLKIGIFAFVLGAIIFGSVGVIAAQRILAADISYVPKNSAWKVSTVEEAVDSLYISKTSNNYSTEEKKVGTWIDGKPVYQRTITGSFSSGIPRTNWGRATFFPNIERIIFAYGYYGSNNTFCNISEINILDSSTGEVEMITDNGRTLTSITLQYTKTTDQIPSQNNEG